MNRREYIKYTTGLLGYAVSSTAVLQLMASCNNQPGLEWKPVFFSLAQASLITEVAGTILPETQTPGAISLGIPQLVDRLFAELLSADDKKSFLEGMSNFEEDCIKKYGRGFQSLDKAQKEQYLIDQDKNGPKFPISMWGINLDPHPQPITFYRRLKSMVLMGYYTSEKISKEVLVYAPVPGDYMGCVPIGARNSYAD